MKYIVVIVLCLLAVSTSAQQQRTADKAWWIANGVSWGLTVADFGNTLYGLRQPGVREANPLLGHHPSVGRMLAVGLPITSFQTYMSYRWKKQDDADRLAGVKLAKIRWYWMPAVNATAHGVAIGVSIGLTGR